MLALLSHELKYYFRNINEAIYIYSLFLSIIVLVPFGLSAGAIGLLAIAPAILWIALAVAVSIGGMTLFARDGEQGRLEAYQLLPISLEKLLLAKWAAFYLMITLPLLAMVPLAGLLMGIPAAEWLHYAIGLAVGGAALSVLTSLASAVMAGLDKAGAILSLVILPLSIPIMIFGTHYCLDASQNWQPSLLFNIGFAGFLLPIYCIAGASCIRAAN